MHKESNFHRSFTETNIIIHIHYLFIQSSQVDLCSSGLHEPCRAVGPAILCQKFSFFSNCHVVTLCMHEGIVIERNLLENSLILEKKETYF